MDSILSPLPPTLRESVEKWVAYKGERREEYKPVGLQSLVTQITKAACKNGKLCRRSGRRIGCGYGPDHPGSWP